MIIDTTISTMEDQMKVARRFEEIIARKYAKNPVWHWPAERRANIQYRESAIRDFLIKQGRDPERDMNYITFWKDGEVIDVHLLSEPSQQSKKEKYSEHLNDLLNKFMTFMKRGLSNQKSQELSK